MSLAALLQTVEQSARHGQVHTRSDVLKHVSDAFVAKAKRLPADQEALFDQLFLSLSDGADARTRQNLACALAPFPKAPRGIINKLAQDTEPDVAGPVLEQSVRLHEDLLVKLASTRGNKHLTAIAKRKNLTITVTTPLIERGEESVLLEILRNETAEVAHSSFKIITERAERSDLMLPAACARPDLPNENFERLLSINLGRISEEIDAAYGSPELFGVEVVALTVTSLGRTELDQISQHLINPSIDFVAWRSAIKDLGEKDIGRWLARRQIEDALVGISHLSAIPVHLVARLCCSESMTAMAMLMRALNFGWPVTKLMLQHIAQRNAGIEDFLQTYELFTFVTPETARRVMRHAALCQKVLAFPQVSSSEPRLRAVPA